MPTARPWGHDFPAYEEQGLLHIVSLYPEVASLDDHLVEIRDLVERLQPTRLTIDSLSSLERLGSDVAYREFIISITSFIKTVGLASVMTAASAQLVGATSGTESHISGLIDTIVLLRHVEHDSSLKRGILVLKMRGSSHEHQIRELSVATATSSSASPSAGSAGSSPASRRCAADPGRSGPGPARVGR